MAEPLGVAIMEAMALELPVVVTGQGGVRELVEDGAAGILVPAEGAEALASGIVRVALDPALAVWLWRATRQDREPVSPRP
jgi:glycosyltransferase involved in cell wall biosynthesis